MYKCKITVFIGKFHTIMAKFILFVHKEVDVLQTQVTYHSVRICWEEWGHRRWCWWVLEGWRHTPVRRFGTLSAPSTCGIPPGDAGVTLLVGVSLHGDSHTFRFLLDRVSRAEGGCC